MKVSILFFLIGNSFLVSIGMLYCMEDGISDEKSIIIMDQLAEAIKDQQQSKEALLNILKLNQSLSDYQTLKLCCDSMPCQLFTACQNELLASNDLVQKWAVFAKYCVLNEQHKKKTKESQKAGTFKLTQSKLKRLFHEKIAKKKRGWIIKSLVCGIGGFGAGACMCFFL